MLPWWQVLETKYSNIALAVSIITRYSNFALVVSIVNGIQYSKGTRLASIVNMVQYSNVGLAVSFLKEVQQFSHHFKYSSHHIRSQMFWLISMTNSKVEMI